MFSGDLWSPSKLTSVFKGEHLVDIMNALKVDAAALGNHDLVRKRILYHTMLTV